MKIIIISRSVLAFIFVLSLSSFSFDKKESKKTSAGVASFDAGLFRLRNTNKVKLSVDRGDESVLRISLKDSAGKVYYNETYHDDEVQYRRVFDMNEMSDGKYYFELLYKDRKLTKEIRLESTKGRTILIQ
jgi:hypothetical protein